MVTCVVDNIRDDNDDNDEFAGVNDNAAAFVGTNDGFVVGNFLARAARSFSSV